MKNSLIKSNSKNSDIAIKIITKSLTVFFMAIMIIYCLSLIYPIVWMIMNSFKGYIEYYQTSSLTLPKEWVFENYTNVFSKLVYKVVTVNGRLTFDIWTMLYYSVAYALGTAVYSTITITLTSYAVGKFKFWLTKLIFAIGIFMLIFPGVTDGGVSLLLRKKLGIYDNMTLQILTSGTCIFSGQYFFIMVAFFDKMGKEYYEAGQIDGANQLQILLRIMIPLSIPLMTVIFVLSFVSSWNNYSVFLYYLPSYANLSLGMYSFQMTAPIRGDASVTEVLAGFVIVAIPAIILYGLSQKAITSNLTIGGLKG